ncbi:endonuclease/exonuclease/phosphatase family protein [Actinomycetes bacterium KLBMP 9797]
MTATAAATLPDMATVDTKRDWRPVLRRLLIGAPALWLLFVVVHLLVSGRVWWWRPADLVPPPAFLVIPVLLALAAVPCRRSRRPAAVLAAGALAIGTSLAGVNATGMLTGGGPVPPGALRVVAWNTGYWHEAGETADFYDLLRAQHADVYLLQEYLNYPADVPVRIDEVDRLRAELPGYDIAVAGELVTLSRYPIVDQRALDAPGAPPPPADTDFPEFWRHKALRTDLRVGDGVLSVYNVHVTTPIWIGGPGPLSRSFWDTIRDLDAERGPHLRALAADVSTNDGPVLVVGDMNTTPAMGERQAFPAGLRDAAAASGAPYLASWPADGSFPRWWRLDWALVSPGMTVHRYDFVDPAGLSDHRLQFLAVSP